MFLNTYALRPARPNGLRVSRAPASTASIGRESDPQKTNDLERPSRGGRLHALVGPPPQNGARKGLINPVDDRDAVNLSKMAYITSDECRSIRQDNTGDEQISTPNLPICFGDT